MTDWNEVYRDSPPVRDTHLKDLDQMAQGVHRHWSFIKNSNILLRGWLEVAITLQHWTSAELLLNTLMNGEIELTFKQKLAIFMLSKDGNADE